ncbi:MAG: Choline transport ATP-binding protein OpuBA [Candidatus Heimdallarchaeota archaeon LC_2]|nr:MAG: Choline transport ATP-binding protein OpuBA [Candidatus Heimdallarchaeota archaeon LC_2]
MKEFSSINSIQLESIELSFNGVIILSNLNLKLDKTGINCILGPNGSGKTLTNKILSLLIKPNKGRISWNGIQIDDQKDINDLVHLRRKIGYMSQKPLFLKKSLRENVELPLIFRGYTKEKRRLIVDEGLKEFNLLEFQNRSPQKLSLGEQQRASFLRTIISDPQILILDEPTSSLDPANTLWFEDYMKNNIDYKTQLVVITSHDQFQVKRIAHNISFIIRGTVVESGLVDKMANPDNSQVKKYLSGELRF